MDSLQRLVDLRILERGDPPRGTLARRPDPGKDDVDEQHTDQSIELGTAAGSPGRPLALDEGDGGARVHAGTRRRRREVQEWRQASDQGVDVATIEAEEATHEFGL